MLTLDLTTLKTTTYETFSRTQGHAFIHIGTTVEVILLETNTVTAYKSLSLSHTHTHTQSPV